MGNKEKKNPKPHSIKFMPSTEKAINKVCQREDRSLSFIAERAIRKDLGLELKS